MTVLGVNSEDCIWFEQEAANQLVSHRGSRGIVNHGRRGRA